MFSTFEFFIWWILLDLFLREPNFLITFLQAHHSVMRDLPVKLFLIGALQGTPDKCGVYIDPHN